MFMFNGQSAATPDSAYFAGLDFAAEILTASNSRGQSNVIIRLSAGAPSTVKKSLKVGQELPTLTLSRVTIDATEGTGASVFDLGSVTSWAVSSITTVCGRITGSAAALLTGATWWAQTTAS